MKRFLPAVIVACGLACVLVAQAQDVDVLQRQGNEARRAGRFEDAVERLEAAAKLRPNDSDIEVELGLALMGLRRYDDAEKAFRRALEISPDYLDARLALARIAFYRKDYEKARTELRAVLDRRPDDADAKDLARQIERATRPAPSSTAEIEKDAAQNPNDADSQLRLGLALTRDRRYDDAEKAFRRVLELSPDYLDARLGLARVFFYRKDYDKARAELRAVLDKRPADADAKDLARQVERATRPAPSSTAEIEEEAAENPNDADLQLRLGLALIGDKRYDDAEKAFRRVLEISPDYLDARLGLARAFFYRKDYDKARAELRAVLDKRPGDAEASDLSRQIERATRVLPTTVAGLMKEAKLHPDDADIQLHLGLALTRDKRYPEAEKAFRRVLELSPDYLDAHTGLARIAYYRKDYKKAQSEVRIVLAKRAGDADARELARLIERARKAAEEEAAKPAAKKEATPPYWRVDLTGEWSHLTGGRQPWFEGDVHVSRVFSPGNAMTAGVNVARHYGQIDAYYDARLDRRLADWIDGYVFGGGTPNAHFRPEYATGAGVVAAVNKQSGLIATTALTFDARYQKFVSGPVRYGAPGIQQYVLGGTMWFTTQWINVLNERNESMEGYLVRGDTMLGDSLRLFVGFSNAPETSENQTIQTRSSFGGIVYDVNAYRTVRASFAYEQRPGLYDRSVFTVGMSLKF